MKQLNLNQLHRVRGGVNDSSVIPASSEGNKTEDENTKTLISRSRRVKISIAGGGGGVIPPRKMR